MKDNTNNDVRSEEPVWTTSSRRRHCYNHFASVQWSLSFLTAFLRIPEEISPFRLHVCRHTAARCSFRNYLELHGSRTRFQADCATNSRDRLLSVVFKSRTPRKNLGLAAEEPQLVRAASDRPSQSGLTSQAPHRSRSPHRGCTSHLLRQTRQRHETCAYSACCR